MSNQDTKPTRLNAAEELLTATSSHGSKTPYPITICSAEEKDAAMVSSLATTTFRETFPWDEHIEYRLATQFTPAKLHSQILDPEVFIYLALSTEDQEKAVGFLLLRSGRSTPWDLEVVQAVVPGKKIEIQKVYVLEAFQRMGIGETLMDYAEQQAKGMGFEGVWLSVLEANEKAKVLYTKKGYAKIGERAVRDLKTGEGNGWSREIMWKRF